MTFLALVIVDGNEQEVADIFRYLGRILFSLDLVDGSICVFVVFQFQDDDGGVHVLSKTISFKDYFFACILLPTIGRA